MNLLIHPTPATYLSLTYKPPLLNLNNKILQLNSLLTKKKPRSVKVLVVNCRSIADQKKEYKNIIHSTEPDVVIDTESWLKLKQFDKEIFSPDQGYTPFRSGVFIAVRNDSIVQEMKDIQSDCEDVWINID